MNWFSYKKSIYKLNSLRQKEKERYLKRLEEVKRIGDRDEIEKVKYEGYFNLKILDEEISVLVTERLISKANKLLVPIPDKPVPEPGEVSPENENWITGDLGRWYMTPKGISEVRNSIWNHREKMRSWISIIIGLIGAFAALIGALTALIAIYR